MVEEIVIERYDKEFGFVYDRDLPSYHGVDFNGEHCLACLDDVT